MPPVKARSSTKRPALAAQHGALILRSALLACLLLLVRILGGELSGTVIIVLVAAIFGSELLPNGFIQIGARGEPPDIRGGRPGSRA
jgi:hypothetical protein